MTTDASVRVVSKSTAVDATLMRRLIVTLLIARRVECYSLLRLRKAIRMSKRHGRGKRKYVVMISTTTDTPTAFLRLPTEADIARAEAYNQRNGFSGFTGYFVSEPQWGPLRRATRFRHLHNAIVCALEHGGAVVKYNAHNHSWSKLKAGS